MGQISCDFNNTVLILISVLLFFLFITGNVRTIAQPGNVNEIAVPV